MYKMKTHTGSAKRFIVTKSGRLKRSHAFKNHILSKKSTKRKRSLRKAAPMSAVNEPAVKRMMPYV